MPYKIKKNSTGKFCVHNSETGENKGCSDTRAMAIKHMRALYAASSGETMGKKEIEDMIVKSISDSDESEDLLKCYGEMASYAYVPWGITSFADLDAWKEAQEASDAIRSDADTFTQLVGNIMGTSEVEDKVSAIKALADEFGERVRSNSDDMGDADKQQKPAKKPTVFAGIANKVKNLFAHNENKHISELMIYKDGEDYRWIARYSNNFRDDDNPPEIISSKSHEDFVSKVDKGLAPLPEFWIWHVPEWNIGQAEWVAWDDTGFSLAGGRFAKGLSSLAEHLSTVEDIKVSHGMPIKSIQRDPEDNTVITAHETREISILPGWSAANQLTGFVVLKETNQEEASMAIPKDKRKTLMEQWKLSEEQLSAIESFNANDANKAKEEGLESKETTDAAPATEPVVTETPVVETPTPTLNVDELRSVLTSVVEASVKPLADRLNQLEGEMKALKESDGQKMSDLVKNSTTASLSALLGQSIKSVIGLEDTVVDGRTSLAKDKPKESKANIEGRTLVPFINEILASPKSQ